MSNVNPREVLLYLNELGYTNITAQQLKEFIRDLKKLIKYEQQQRNEKPSSCARFQDESNTDIFTRLYTDRTLASRAKETHKKESVISVEVRKPRRQFLIAEPEHPQVLSEAPSSTHRSDCRSVQVSSEQLIRPKSCCSDSQKTSRPNEKENFKPKGSFIRTRNVKNCKSDPVSLYHRYQAEWKKQKIPGEDNRSDLRWAIRERMLGGPKVVSSGHSIETLARRRQNSNNRL